MGLDGGSLKVEHLCFQEGEMNDSVPGLKVEFLKTSGCVTVLHLWTSPYGHHQVAEALYRDISVFNLDPFSSPLKMCQLRVHRAPCPCFHLLVGMSKSINPSGCIKTSGFERFERIM